jgi:hypothetical protein
MVNLLQDDATDEMWQPPPADAARLAPSRPCWSGIDFAARAAAALRAARRLPPGAERNEFRQLAYALRWLGAHPLSPERELKLRQMLGNDP